MREFSVVAARRVGVSSSGLRARYQMQTGASRDFLFILFLFFFEGTTLSEPASLRCVLDFF